MEDKDIEKLMNSIMAEAILKAITDAPAITENGRGKSAEKSMAWIELHEDVLDEAYDMSKEYREYD